MQTANCNFLKDDGTPNVSLLIETFNRCAPTNQYGTKWMDDVRFCRWPGQQADGKKHDVPGDPKGKAKPWDNASDCRPFVVDDIINERAGLLTTAFWRSLVQSGAGGSKEAGYAVALLEWLIFTKLSSRLMNEVELSANYQEHYGWTLLAPRWVRELGLKRATIKLEMIAQGAADAAYQVAQARQAAAQNQTEPQIDPWVAALAELPGMIADPLREGEAVKFLQDYYDRYVAAQVPADLINRVPKTTEAQARRMVAQLRRGEDATCALPYLAKNEPEISALKPWDEVYLPPELTTENEIVFQLERVTEAELRGRIQTMGYDAKWVEEALRHRGEWSSHTLPVGTAQGIAGNIGGAAGPAVQTPGAATSLDGKTGPIVLVYAIYRAADADGIPAVYCTTLHPQITAAPKDGNKAFAAHELVEDVNHGDMPYVALTRERWARAITSSRSVCEMAATQQNLVKGFLDAMIDRESIMVLPPVNIYESPLEVNFEFGPARRNFVRPGKEPRFMEGLPTGQGMGEALQVHNIIRKTVDNRFGSLSEDVPVVRQQTAQEKAVRRFLMSWTKAFQQVMHLYQKHGDDAEFARVTGAPVGWLEARREQDGLLGCALDFDVRELDGELMMKRIEAMNKMVLPTDVMGVVQRGKWAQVMTRAVLGPVAAKQIVVSEDDASQAVVEKARQEVLQMFAGNAPRYVDDQDPTAPALLKATMQVVMSNRQYLRALNDEALVTLAGQNATALLQQIGDRRVDEIFSGLLLKWVKNLQFVGQTQPQNAQTGRLGVNPQE